MSDFPEFDKAYKTVLMKDQNDKFERLASEANFNVYHSDIWRGTGRKFAELIIKDVLSIIDNIATDHYNADEFIEHLTVDWVATVIKRRYGLDKDFSGCFLCGQDNPSACDIFKCPTYTIQAS